jgi:N6-adenosine-specific RNA methylase IME4
MSEETKAERRARREAELGAKQRALPDKRYGVIYADPAWQFGTWSENGKDRSAENHYPCMPTAAICALPVQTIAAGDCVLFLWATVPMLPAALQVMEAWGFAYKSHLIWYKEKVANGYWSRNRPELLLIGTRGKKIPAPAPGTQSQSLIKIRATKHSKKPAWFAELIEELYPTLPRVELFARGNVRPGWDGWGNEFVA